jgi:1,2-phenylacetyl-CoA epoxidase catalytic subunit
VATLHAQGLLRRGNRELRQAYLDRVGALLEETGVRLGLTRDPTTGRWQEASLPWERWNRLQRRLDPTPTATSR